MKQGVTANDVEQILRCVAIERNMKEVGFLPLYKAREARFGVKQKLHTVHTFCTPATACHRVEFSPHIAAYLPCRISVVERDDGLRLYTLNRDLLVKRRGPCPARFTK